MSQILQTSRWSSFRLCAEDYEYVRQLSLNEGRSHRCAKRAKFILAYAHGLNVTDAARLAGFSRPVAYRWLDRVAKLGVKAGLSDKPYELNDRSPEACAWVLDLVRNHGGQRGFNGQPWTVDSLARYVRAFAIRAGFPELARVTSGGIGRILEAANEKLEQPTDQ